MWLGRLADQLVAGPELAILSVDEAAARRTVDGYPRSGTAGLIVCDDTVAPDRRLDCHWWIRALMSKSHVD